MTTQSSRETLEGRTLGEFTLREKIGEGGFATVHRAFQATLEREAVVKVLHTRLTKRSDVTQRFLREARLTSRLDHPYAAHVYAFGAEPDGTLWIAMELVRGTPMDKLLEQQPIPLDRFVPLFERICEVVQTAHERGIIHRDLKPANVMVLSRAGRLLPKLLDFGIARLLDDVRRPEAPRTPPSATDHPDYARTLDEGAAVTHASEPSTTRAGAIMGSPLYMAPEQWADAASVDKSVDIYALGVLAYEALTGRVPFAATSMHEIMVAHAAVDVPPLGGDLPTALDAVLARALAKKKEDRYATAGDLAAAVRAATGRGDTDTLPQLDEPLRDAMSAGAPQPLADAVGALEAARNVDQACALLWDVVLVATRWVGALTLAARTKIGPGGDDDTRDVQQRLRGLGRGDIGDQEWLALARALTQPFFRKREAYPLPELIGMLHGDVDLAVTPSDSLDPGPPFVEAFHRLRTLRGVLDRRAGRSDEQRRELYAEALAATAELLRPLRFLLDYTVIVTRKQRAERWRGLRRSPRPVTIRRARPLPEGEAYLLDGDGTPILKLAPLVQTGPPAPGKEDELFLFDGRGAHGARLVAVPHGFERHDEQLDQWFRENLIDLSGDGSEKIAEETAPYRGLATFTTEDSGFYFGREKEVDAFINRLRVETFLAVVGPSGAGKSSFVQAGVIPRLPTGWRAIVLRPGISPASLARLGKYGVDAEGLAANPRVLVERLRATAAREGSTIVLVIDQLEELFTLWKSDDDREAFAEAIVEAAGSEEDPLRVVVTLRDDFLIRAESEPALSERLGRGIKLLTTPSTEDLERILVEPAKRVGYQLEDRALVTEMVEAVAGMPGALALLSFTAAELWKLRDRHFHQLSRKSYTAIGGVGGALAKHAESTLAEMSSDEQRLAREAFRVLVTAEGTRQVLQLAELQQVLAPGKVGKRAATDSDVMRAAAVIDRLIAARLVVVSEEAGGAQSVEVIHEALLSAWPRLVEWRREDAEGARLRDQLRSAAKQWDARNRPRGLLWRGEALAEYRIWRARYPGALTDVEEAFGVASVADATRGRRIRRGLLITVFAVLAVAVLVFLQISREERRQRLAAATERQRAESLLATSYEDQGARLVLAGDSLTGLVFLNEALQKGRDVDAVRYALARGFRSIEGERATFSGHVGAVWTIAFSPDGQQLASGGDDGTVIVWDVVHGTKQRVLNHGAIVRTIAFLNDGMIASGGDDGVIRLWRPDGVLERSLEMPSSTGSRGVSELRTDARGIRVLATSPDNNATLWDVATGAKIRTFPFGDRGLGADLATDGSRLVVAKGGLGAEIWDVTHDRRIASITGPDVGSGAFWLFLRLSPRHDRVLSIGWNEPARLWDASDGHLVATLDGSMGNRNYGEFSADGARVVTTGANETVKTWDATTGELIATMRGHTGAVNMIAFAADGTVASGAMDGVVRFWDPHTGVSLAAHAGHDRPIFALAAHQDRIASGGWDGSVRMYVRTTGDLLASVEVSRGIVNRLAMSSDDKTVVVGAVDGRAAQFDVTTGKQIGAPHVHAGPVGNVGITRDGTWVSGGGDGNVVVTVPGGTSFTLSSGAPIASLATHPVDRLLAVYRANGKLEIWDLVTRAQVAQHAARPNEGGQVVFHPDGRRVAYYTQGEPDPLGFWDWTTDRETKVAALGILNHLAFNPGGKAAIATATGVVVLDTAGSRVASTNLPGATPISVAFARDTILIACGDSVARVIDARTASVIGQLRGHAATVAWIDFVPNTQLLVTGAGDSTLRVWNATNLAPLAVLDAHGPVMAAAITSSGSRLVAIGMDGRLSIWDLSRDTRTSDAIAEAVRCRVPRRLQGGRVVSATLDGCQ